MTVYNLECIIQFFVNKNYISIIQKYDLPVLEMGLQKAAKIQNINILT